MPFFCWVANQRGGFDPQIFHVPCPHPIPASRVAITEDEASQDLDVLAEKYPAPEATRC